MQQPPKKKLNVYDGKTREEILKMRNDDIRSAEKQIMARKLEKKMTTPMDVIKGGNLEKALKNNNSPKNSEGRTAAQEKEYMKSMEENYKNVEQFKKNQSGELGGAGFAARSARLAEAARKLKLSRKK
jgi:hypothetical protein